MNAVRGRANLRAMGRSWLAAAALMLSVTGLADRAHAQDQSATKSSAASPSQQGDTTVDAVVVTARRREESIRDVPATVTAVTAGELAATGPVQGTGDLLRLSPGVRFNDLAAPNLSEVSIRGSGTQRATGADSSVGLFFNGAYTGSSTLGGRNFRTLDYFDLERVEVLKGPQGALYGRNSEFGSVNIIPAKPQFKYTGYVDETYTGGLDQNRIQGVFNMPLGDDFAIRIGAESFLQDGGFYKNTLTGDYYDHTDGWLLRAQLRYRHGPLDVNFLYDAQDMNLPVFINSYVLPAGAAATIPTGFTQDPYNIPHNGADSTNQRLQRAQLVIDYNLGWAKLTSTTMSTDFHSDQNYSSAIDLGTEAFFQSQGFVGVYPLAQTSTRSKDSSLYEDFHATGGLFADRLTWLVGAEALYQRTSNGLLNVTNPCTLTATSGICGGQPGALTCYRLLPTSLNCPAVYPASFGATQVTPQQYLSVAGYGSLRFDIGWGLSVSGELRYTTDDKKAQQNAFRLYTLTPAGTNTAYEFQADRTNYTVTASWKAPNLPSAWQQLLYFRTGTGYRAGGINPGISSPLAPNPFMTTYDNEDTTSYEAGLKGNLGRNIYFTIAGYSSQTTNAIASINDGCTVLNACKQGATVFNINGGTEDASGVEATINGRFDVAGGRLALGLTGATQQATYSAVRAGYPGLPIVGSTVAQLPDYTMSGTLDYAHAITSSVDGFFHMTWNGQWGGGQDTVTPTAPLVPLFDYNLVSLRTGVNWGRTQIAVFVQNLTDEMFPALQLQLSAGVPLSYRYNQPRTYGVSVSHRW